MDRIVDDIKNYEIKKIQYMAIKASKYAKFKIVDFFGLENLELNKYKHNLTSLNIIIVWIM